VNLIPRIEFNRLWGDTNCQGNGNAVFLSLVQAYSGARRHYHTLHHIMWVLTRIDQITAAPMWNGTPDETAALRWAAWYHDFVLQGLPDDEFASADCARKMLTTAGRPDLAATVERLIMATAHDAHDLKPDEAILSDADIAILGADREAFDDYERLVRLEWPFIGDEQFAAGRAAILQKFLERPRIYFTDYGRERWEQKARENLAYSIGKLCVLHEPKGTE
jgi:predicted metal-dependent HD superfamily phosphohydrolase